MGRRSRRRGGARAADGARLRAQRARRRRDGRAGRRARGVAERAGRGSSSRASRRSSSTRSRPGDLPDEPLELARRRARRARARSCASCSSSATRRCSRSPAAASSPAAAASSTCSRRRPTLPVRIESFGDEIDSLRAFDPTDQRTTGKVDRVVLLPASEFLVPAGRRCEALAARLGPTGGAAAGAARRRIWSGSRAAAATRARGDARRGSRAAAVGDAAEIWAPLLAPSTALDHLGPETLFVLDEPGDIGEAAEFLWRQADERRADLVGAGELPKDWPPTLLPPRDWKRRLLAARTLELTWESEASSAIAGGGKSSGDLFGWREPQLPPGRSARIADAVERWRADEGTPAADRHRLGPGAAPRRAPRGGRATAAGVTDAIDDAAAAGRHRRSSIGASTAASPAARTGSSSSPIASCSATSASAGRRRCAGSCPATSSSG